MTAEQRWSVSISSAIKKESRLYHIFAPSKEEANGWAKKQVESLKWEDGVYSFRKVEE